MSDLLRETIETYGRTSQIIKAVEECGEFVAVAGQHLLGREDVDIITEIADVMIMMKQMAMIFGEKAVNDEVSRKLERLEERMKK